MDVLVIIRMGKLLQLAEGEVWMDGCTRMF